MNVQPVHIEARVNALERRQSHTEVRIEELAVDVTASFKEQTRDMNAGFKEMATYIGKIEDRFDRIEATMATKADLQEVKADLREVKADLQEVKADMAAMEDRILSAFSQLVAAIAPKGSQQYS